HLEFTLDDVPDLREVVLVQREAGARFVAQEADIGHGRSLGRGMEQELGDVPEAAHLPFHLVGMPEFGGVVGHALPPRASLRPPSAFSAGANPLSGAVWTMASITSVRLSPMLSADWPNFFTWPSSFSAVKAATATSARRRKSRPGRNQISP